MAGGCCGDGLIRDLERQSIGGRTSRSLDQGRALGPGPHQASDEGKVDRSMRKIQKFGFALFAVVAFSATAATGAFAEPEWLVELAAINQTLPAETEGLWNMISLESGNELVAIDCEGVLDGTIGPPVAAKPGVGTDEITSVLSLNQETISSTQLSGLALGCLVAKSAGVLGDCMLNTLAAVWPENLPWKTEMELMAAAPIWLDILSGPVGKEPAWESECSTNIGTQSLLCEGLVSAAVSNEAGTVPPSVLGEFSVAAGTEEESCSATPINSDLEGSNNTWAIGAELARLETAIS
jgi:hypothetical protein